MLDKYPIIIDRFKGIRVTDVDNAYEPKNVDVVPFDYGFEFDNLQFLKTGGMKTRDGFGLLLSAAGISITGDLVQFWQIKTLEGVDQVNRWLVLTWDGTTGRIYDTAVASPATNPIAVVVGMKYAFVINAFSRMYISPWEDWGVPLSTTTSTLTPTPPGIAFQMNRVLLYNGKYNARFMGLPIIPGPGTLAAATGGTGQVTAGVHLIDVAFESDTGYISHLAGLGGGVQYTAPGAKEINITNIPLGPSPETKQRHLVMTKIISGTPSIDGFFAHEPFFAAVVPDNTTTSFVINKADSGLVDSAADLLDKQFIQGGVSTGRCCVTMSVYNNRMIYHSPKNTTADPSGANSIFISPPGLPEDVPTGGNIVGGHSSRLFVGQQFTGRVLNGAELRGAYYIFKEDSVFAIQDNPDLDPAEWAVNLIDAGLGAYTLGIASVTDNPGGLILDNLLVGGPSGIHRFTGTFDPIPISLGWWDGFSPEDLKFIQLFCDPVRKLIFASFNNPLSPNKFFFCGNYYEGFDANRIKWSRYVFPSANANWTGKIPWLSLVAAGGSSPYPTPTIGYKGASDGLITLETEVPNKTKDLSINADIIWSWITGYTPSNEGDLLNFTGVRLRAIIEDLLMSISYSALDSDEFIPLESVSMAQNPGKFFTRIMSHVGEKVRLKFTGSSKAIINRLILYATDYGKDRAR